MKLRSKSLITSLFLLLPLATSHAQDLDEIRADCQVEGEAGGLEGKALDDFVRECVEELKGLNLDTNKNG